MLVTMTHLRWYQERTQPTWLHKVSARKGIEPGKPQVTVHELINLQDRSRKADDHEMHNLLHLLRLAVRNGESLRGAVHRLWASIHSNSRRKALAGRILRHLREQG